MLPARFCYFFALYASSFSLSCFLALTLSFPSRYLSCSYFFLSFSLFLLLLLFFYFSLSFSFSLSLSHSPSLPRSLIFPLSRSLSLALFLPSSPQILREEDSLSLNLLLPRLFLNLLRLPCRLFRSIWSFPITRPPPLPKKFLYD